MISDKMIELWDEVLAGNQKAYAELHKSLYPRLFIYANKMINDNDLADDLLQDLFVKFWETKFRIGQLKNVEAYFYRSMRSMVLNHLRMSKHRDSKLLSIPVVDMVFSAEEIIVSQESDLLMKAKILSALNALPTKQREILYMRFYDDLSYAHISKVLGIRYQSVINHVYRAIQTLRHLNELSAEYAA